MVFYCPNCRKEYDISEESKDITQSGRVAHKATCPVCQTAVVEFIPGEISPPPVENNPNPAEQ